MPIPPPQATTRLSPIMGVGPSGGFCRPQTVVPEDPALRAEMRHFMHFLGAQKEGEPDEVYGRRFGELVGQREEDNWSVTKEVFLKLLTKKGYEGTSPEALFNFLDQQEAGKISAADFAVLAVASRIIGRPKAMHIRLETPKLLESLEARARRRLWTFKVFIRNKFGGSPAQFWAAMGKERGESVRLQEFEKWMQKFEFEGDAEATFSLLDEDCWGKVTLENLSGMLRAASKDGSEKGSQRSLTREPEGIAGAFSERSKTDSQDGASRRQSIGGPGKENAAPSNGRKRGASKGASGGGASKRKSSRERGSTGKM